MQVSSIYPALKSHSSFNFGKNRKKDLPQSQAQQSQQQKISVPNGMVLLPVATVVNMAAAAGAAGNAVPVQPYGEPQPIDKVQTIKRNPYVSEDLSVVRNFNPSKVDMSKVADPFQQVSFYVRPEVVQWKSAPFKSKDGNTYTLYFTNAGKELNHNNRYVSEVYLYPSNFVPIGDSKYCGGKTSPPKMYGIVLHTNGAREEVGILCSRRDSYYGMQKGEVPVPDHIADEIFDLINGDNPRFDFRDRLDSSNLIETSNMNYRPFK